MPLYGTVPTAGFLRGTALVIASLFLYNSGSGPSTPKLQTLPPTAPTGDDDA